MPSDYRTTRTYSDIKTGYYSTMLHATTTSPPATEHPTLTVAPPPVSKTTESSKSFVTIAGEKLSELWKSLQDSNTEDPPMPPSDERILFQRDDADEKRLLARELCPAATTIVIRVERNWRPYKSCYASWAESGNDTGVYGLIGTTGWMESVDEALDGLWKGLGGNTRELTNDLDRDKVL
ncbi:hypothetical protein K458DRAFT_395747 [Lentithecium fluviatile CBS 122367]|uniref:Uncharacterized protein n=1 Tax=Lentithecium fluviatile CBS 122367 TaxID=1168545 RepID=A0A6G1IHW5_9PLEO|nr:hypothetical protein K458DRAFT_395747 [Lentithecium fluviatile CBS 122367]